ncbi:MAG: GntR family transcriptional regulator, partial [Thermodesulfobacteriota bacterium]
QVPVCTQKRKLMPSTVLPKDRFPSPVRISDSIYRHLQDKILKGHILPAERLVEFQIARENGVSRTPVREALHLLERDGWIESVPRVGYMVRPISRQEMREMREIRLANETLALRWAIDRITPEKVQAMEMSLADAESDITEGRWEDFIEKAAEFHRLFVEASGSVRLAELCQNLQNHMLRYRLESLYKPEACRQVNNGHRRLLEKIKQLDTEGAVAELADHLKMSESFVLRYAFQAKPGEGEHA